MDITSQFINCILLFVTAPKKTKCEIEVLGCHGFLLLNVTEFCILLAPATVSTLIVGL